MANFQPVNSIQTLAQMDKVPLWMSNDALDALDRGRQADQSSLAALVAANAHEQAMNPLKMRQQELQNQTSEATLPGIVATSGMLQRKNKMEERFFPEEVQAKLNKFALEASENDIKSLEANAQRRLYRNPNDKAALQLLQASKSMIEARQKHADEMEKERLRAQTSRYVADKGAESRVAAANISAAVRKAAAGANAKKLEQIQAELNMALMTERDPEKRQEIYRNIDFIIGQRQAILPVPLQPAQAVERGQLEPQPPRPTPAMPAAPGAPTQPKKQFSGADAEAAAWADANPNDPRAKIINQRLGR